jgi:hypothetical protein
MCHLQPGRAQSGGFTTPRHHEDGLPQACGQHGSFVSPLSAVIRISPCTRAVYGNQPIRRIGRKAVTRLLGLDRPSTVSGSTWSLTANSPAPTTGARGPASGSTSMRPRARCHAAFREMDARPTRSSAVTGEHGAGVTAQAGMVETDQITPGYRGGVSRAGSKPRARRRDGRSMSPRTVAVHEEHRSAAARGFGGANGTIWRRRDRD